MAFGLFIYTTKLIFRTHTMLGGHPTKSKASTPSSATSSGSDSVNSQGDGLMVKAIDDVFKYVEESEDPKEFQVSVRFYVFMCVCVLCVWHVVVDVAARILV